MATPDTALTEDVAPEQKEPEPDFIEAVTDAVEVVTTLEPESSTFTTMFAKVAPFAVFTG